MIKKYRELRNLTQEELAEKLNISTRQEQRIENEENNLTIDNLKKLVRILNISDEDILKYIKPCRYSYDGIYKMNKKTEELQYFCYKTNLEKEDFKILHKDECFVYIKNGTIMKEIKENNI
mgnify:FL=1